MKSTEDKREYEKRVITQMIAVYCRGNHKDREKHAFDSAGDLCAECTELATYANERTDKCRFMAEKTFCSNCTVHCYRPEMREKIRAVMRYSGPRMLLYHPIAAIRHMALSQKEKRASV